MEEPFERVIGIDEVARLLKVPKSTVNQWLARSRSGENIRHPMPVPIPKLSVPAWLIEEIVEWAAKSSPSRWPKDRPEPEQFLAEMGIKQARPSPEDDNPLAADPVTPETPDRVTFSSPRQITPVFLPPQAEASGF